MADDGMRRTDIRDFLRIGKEDGKSFHLPKSDVPSVPESRMKPGSNKPT
jgi:hypothetical protein